MLAALISLLGTLVLVGIGNLIATAYFAGKLAEKVENIDQRVSHLECSERATAIELARTSGALDIK